MQHTIPFNIKLGVWSYRLLLTLNVNTGIMGGGGSPLQHHHLSKLSLLYGNVMIFIKVLLADVVDKFRLSGLHF